MTSHVSLCSLMSSFLNKNHPQISWGLQQQQEMEIVESSRRRDVLCIVFRGSQDPGVRSQVPLAIRRTGSGAVGEGTVSPGP